MKKFYCKLHKHKSTKENCMKIDHVENELDAAEEFAFHAYYTDMVNETLKLWEKEYTIDVWDDHGNQWNFNVVVQYEPIFFPIENIQNRKINSSSS